MNLFILITGFMGAGKTTFLKRLEEFSAPGHYIDLDAWMALSQNKSVRSLIEELGLEKFRELEKNSLETLMAQVQNSEALTVVALGGGTLTEETFRFIEKHAHARLVFLNTPFEECYRRIQGDTERPLSGLGKAELHRLYQERLPFYQRAQVILSPEECTHVKNLSEILSRIRQKEIIQ